MQGCSSPSLFGSASSTDACSAWCGQVLPTATARTRGSCTDGIQCQCQAADGQVYASCRMICSAEATSTSTTQGITTTTTTTERQKAPAANIPAFRQLLYDTRVFVDFLTQVEVFFVAVELVRRLNLLVQETCTGSDAAGDACRPWSLVLPPWCFVPLWYVEPSNTTRWEALFDMEKLPSEVHVQEFSKQRVDLGVVPVEIGSRQASKMKDGLGDFLGFTKDMQMCDANGQQAPEAGSTRGSVVYAGYCDSDITVNSLKCGVLEGGFQALVNLVQSASKRSSSILLKHLDGLQLHKVEGFAAGLPALTPSRALQRSAELFRESSAALGSLPYLAVHLDTHDIAHKDQGLLLRGVAAEGLLSFFFQAILMGLRTAALALPGHMAYGETCSGGSRSCFGVGNGIKHAVVAASIFRDSDTLASLLSMPVLHGHVHVAILVVGQWRTFNTTLSKDMRSMRFVSPVAMAKLKKEGIRSVFVSQLLHVVKPLQSLGFLPDYLLCVDKVNGQHPDIAEAWAFGAKNQVGRIKECLKLVKARELRRNISYEFFVRLRPDLLVLTDLPWPHHRAPCLWARLRAAQHVDGLTGE
eukprot:symbB.v1.2.001786.t1/scaffold95.1/size600632/34